MTAKQFFKSTAFKCIVTLLSILLVCGIFLTIMNSLLEVTAGEKLQRSLSKIYPGKTITVYGKDDKVIDSKKPEGYVKDPLTVGSATISEVYKIVFDDKGQQVTHYLVTSKGTGGYDGGTVTCRVAVIVDGEKIGGIYTVSIESNEKQSFIDRVGASALKQFSELYEDGIYYTQDLITNATTAKTKTAICNAVNGAISYVSQDVLGNEVIDKFEGFYDPQNMINTVISDYTVEGDTVTYKLVTNGSEMPGPFTLNIVVGANGTISSFAIAANGNGSTDEDYEGAMHAGILDGTLFANKNLAYFEGLMAAEWDYVGDDYGNDLSTGASQSNYNCVYACAYALYNYQSCIEIGGAA